MNFKTTNHGVFCLVLAMLFMVENLAAQETTQEPALEGFTRLFNGNDLSGWYAIATQPPREFAALSKEEQAAKIAEARKATGEHWRVENGEIVNDGEGPYLTTDGHYRDYELLIEYKTVAKADSGIYLKGTPQVQIWDTTDESKFKIGADKGSGGLWNNSPGSNGKDPLEKADKPFGEWNKVRILQIGSRTSVWLNESLVVDNALMENRHWGGKAGDRKLPLINRGPIQLQTHGGEIRWRNILLREIPVSVANELLATIDNEGFESVL